MGASRQQLHRAVLIPVLCTLTSCRFAASPAEDATLIFGCYSAPDAPTFRLGPDGMRVAGSGAVVPFRYEARKVGSGINVPLEATDANGHLSFTPSQQDYFYRRAQFSDPAIIIVAFGHEGTVVNYRRSEDARCAV